MFQWWDGMQCVKNRRFLLTVSWFHCSSCYKDTICSIPAFLKMFIKYVQIGIKTFIGLCLWLKCQYIKCDGNDDILKMVMTIGIGIRDCLNRQRLFENLIISPVKSYCELLSKYSFSFVVVYEQFWVIIWWYNWFQYWNNCFQFIAAMQSSNRYICQNPATATSGRSVSVPIKIKCP